MCLLLLNWCRVCFAACLGFLFCSVLHKQEGCLTQAERLSELHYLCKYKTRSKFALSGVNCFVIEHCWHGVNPHFSCPVKFAYMGNVAFMENFAFMEISCRHDRQVVMNDGYTHTHCRRDGQVVVNDGAHTHTLQAWRAGGREWRYTHTHTHTHTAGVTGRWWWMTAHTHTHTLQAWQAGGCEWRHTHTHTHTLQAWRAGGREWRHTHSKPHKNRRCHGEWCAARHW
jgi:hypothetical protein